MTLAHILSVAVGSLLTAGIFLLIAWWRRGKQKCGIRDSAVELVEKQAAATEKEAVERIAEEKEAAIKVVKTALYEAKKNVNRPGCFVSDPPFKPRE